MWWWRIFMLLLSLLGCLSAAFGEELREEKAGWSNRIALGELLVFGYPQVVAVGMFAIVPLWGEVTNSSRNLPISAPGIRVDAEVGGYGEGLAAGFSVPIDTASMVSIKRQRIFRNWRPQSINHSIFDGYMFEYAEISAKFGFGMLKETKPGLSSNNSLIFAYAGFGL